MQRQPDDAVRIHPRVRQGDREQGTFARDRSVMRLTPRQQEIVRLVAEGLKDVVIGRRLGIGTATVKNYVIRIQHRLGLASRHEVARWASARIDPTNPQGRLRRSAVTEDLPEYAGDDSIFSSSGL
jgi:DNA-binding CsgD family transcriptional regulator